MLDFERCLAALYRRDPAADGHFFVAVRSTRIYCRPVCPARTPLRRNLSFYRTAAEAQAAGYRPCLRCRPETAPDSPAWLGSQASINRALRLIDEGALVGNGVGALAGRLGMTPRHLRRLFEQHVGIAPLAVEQTRRVNLAKQLIHETQLPMTDIAFAAGFGSVRRFNEVFIALFDRPPSRLRRTAPSNSSDAITIGLWHRPDFDRATWQASMRDLGHDIDGDRTVLRLDFVGSRASAEVSPKAARRSEVELRGVPIRDLALAISRVRLLAATTSADEDRFLSRPPGRSQGERGHRQRNETATFADRAHAA